MTAQFDQTSPADIERYGKRLLNKTLRTESGVSPIPAEMLKVTIGGHSRGSFGTILERYYYGITPPNETTPDFPEAGVELKSTPLKKLARGGYSAKERLVLNIINYEKEARQTFDTSSFLRKNADIMLVSYEHENGRAAVDHPVRIAQRLLFNELPERDRHIIEDDWEKIAQKIKAGQAHELSEGDTQYLGACTKAANATVTRTQTNGGPAAKPRAFSFKAGYMTVLLRQMLAPEEASEEFEPAIKDMEVLRTKTFEQEILDRFAPYSGKSVEEIQASVGKGLNSVSKDYYAMLARRMIGVKGKKIEEFEKAEIIMKTIQLRGDGMPKEDMSFPTFKFLDLIEEDWDAAVDDEKPESSFKEQLQKRFLFVIYQCEGDCKQGDKKRFVKSFFWTMPHDVLESEVRRVWLKATGAVKESDTSKLPKKSGSEVAHVRPHGRNAADTNTLPNGTEATKRCFWLDKKFIKKVIDAHN